MNGANGKRPEDESDRHINPEPPSRISAASPEPLRPPSGALLQPIRNRRVLIVDDNPAIHDDFRKVLNGGLKADAGLKDSEVLLFGPDPLAPVPSNFELESAFQGQQALERVRASLALDKPFAMAFVDVRMPPGWDGVETVKRLWEVDPDLQVVICTAYSDYSWEEVLRQVGASDNLVILKKPFDNVEVLQLAFAFTRKWELNEEANLRLEHLARLVEERTREVEAANQDVVREMQERLSAERQLRQAQKMEAVGQLASGVAHDFNNILTVIHGHASMLKMRLGQEGAHAKSIAEIIGSAERAANLVRQLLAFSRKQLLQFRNVDLSEVVRSISSMVRHLVGEHISVEIDGEPTLPLVFADRGMIEQVIVNLTVNARDAMPNGGRMFVSCRAVTLREGEVASRPESRKGSFVQLTVSDTGSGMDAKTLAHLFEPFFTTKEVGKGTGLGLATVYGIVKQHQGWIEVQTRVGCGTTFQIYLPVSAESTVRVVPASLPPPQRTGTETILVAEDETALREMVVEVLTLQGYRVLAAGSGPAALQVWHQEKNPIRLVLTDMIMPGGMMGPELANQLRRANPDLKVIYTTGYSPGSAGLQDSVQENVSFLPKPYSPDQLAQLVRTCLDG
jgi:two-component system, NtrC family, sensor kinase